jgi:hypothetical protein
MPRIKLWINRDLPNFAEKKRDFVFDVFHKPTDDRDQEFSSEVDPYLNRRYGELERISSTPPRRRRKIKDKPLP